MKFKPLEIRKIWDRHRTGTGMDIDGFTESLNKAIAEHGVPSYGVCMHVEKMLEEAPVVYGKSERPYEWFSYPISKELEKGIYPQSPFSLYRGEKK